MTDVTVAALELLRQVDCFATLDDDALATLEEKMRTRAYADGDLICREGDPGDWMFVVASGEVAVLQEGGGSPVQVALLGPGEFGGTMSLFEQEPRSATLEARSPVTLWVLDHRTFQQLIEQNASLAMRMLAVMSRQTRRDSQNLAATLRYVDSAGMREIYQECSPEERLILDTINRKVASSESLEGVMNFVYDAIRPISMCDRISVAFLEEDGGRLVSYWTRTEQEPVFLQNGFAADLKESSLRAVLESGRPRVINDLPAYLEAHPQSGSTQLIVREGMRSSMACPLVIEGTAVGLMFRSSRHANAYDDHQVRLHLAIAERLSQAVQKAWHIEQLTSANRAYFEMLGFVSHELKSPLASTVMDAKLLTEGFLGELEQPQHDAVERMIKKCKYLLDLVGEYLNLAKIEGGQLEPQMQPQFPFIQEIVESSIDIVKPQVEAQESLLMREWEEEEIPTNCAPDLLKIVMVNLLSNAVKYGNEKGEIRVGIRRENGHLSVSVWNAGPGFPEEETHKLFRKFSRLQTPELKKRKGTGVGLYTTWRIIQAHHGHIKARSEAGQWAEFSFELPLQNQIGTQTAS